MSTIAAATRRAPSSMCSHGVVEKLRRKQALSGSLGNVKNRLIRHECNALAQRASQQGLRIVLLGQLQPHKHPSCWLVPAHAQRLQVLGEGCVQGLRLGAVVRAQTGEMRVQ